MQKTRRLMDENSVSFQMFLILLSFITRGSESQNVCVQAMSKQYSDVWGGFLEGEGKHAQKPKFGLKKKFTKHFARNTNLSCMWWKDN